MATTTYYYYKSLRKTIIQFLDTFSNIKIARHNTTGDVLKYITVPLKFGPKSKAYTWVFENRRTEEKLPIMGVSMSGIDFSVERKATNKRIRVLKDTDDGTISTYINPIPYNITFELGIWSLNMVDVDQIYEQILPFFTPEKFVILNIPELDTSFDIKIILQSSTPDVSTDWGDDEFRVIKWTSTFVVHSYMFQPLTDIGLINKILIEFYTTDESWGKRDTSSPFTSGAGPADESIYLEGLGYDEDLELLYKYEQFGS